MYDIRQSLGCKEDSWKVCQCGFGKNPSNMICQTIAAKQNGRLSAIFVWPWNECAWAKLKQQTNKNIFGLQPRDMAALSAYGYVGGQYN